MTDASTRSAPLLPPLHLEPKAQLRLGVIGMSEGNGHPYSWSAIFNGYDPDAMAACPFPLIPEYLAQQSFPADQLPGASVTHVWTEDPAQSEHIAAASLIPHVANSIDEMLNNVDAVLLARDDAERHVEMALPILRAGLPVYIDKPIATSVTDLELLLRYERFPGQVFSCSALRYSPSLRLAAEDWATIGDLLHVDAITPKTWAKYGVHLIDPLLQNCPFVGEPAVVHGRRHGEVHTVDVVFQTVSATLTCLGTAKGPLTFRYFGSAGFVEKNLTDTFVTFREALRQFLLGVISRTAITPHDDLRAMVKILEAGATP